MPFSSVDNSLLGNTKENINFREIQNAYTSEYTQLPQHKLMQKNDRDSYVLPGNTGVEPYYNQTELDILNGAGIGSFLKSTGKSLASKAKEELKKRSKKEYEKQKQNVKDEAIRRARRFLDEREMQGAGCGCSSDTEDGSDYDSDVERLLSGAGFGSFINKIKKSAKKTGKDFKKAGKKIKKGIDKVDKVTKPLQKNLKKELTRVGDDIKQSAKDGVLKEIISATLDEGLPIAGEMAGMALGSYMGNPELGSELGSRAGSAGRVALEEQTGYGKKPKIPLEELLEMYTAKTRRGERKELLQLLDKYGAVQKDGQEQKMPMNRVLERYECEEIKKKGKPRGSSARNELIKKIMKKHPYMTLPDASRYIKQKNLKY